MSTRAVLVLAVLTGLVLGIAGARPDHSTPPVRPGSIAVQER
ncbi:hypothetical protein [Streptomyces sp. NPDC002851]